ncbi:3 beta-hydroxysteroid dehydrogenase/Delta 5--_4-isomerase type 1-like [Glandiceps talaboti]
MERPSLQSGDAVIVTGGAGFLGQHIVRLLLTKCDDVSEIITVDVQPFKWIAGLEPETKNAKLRHYQCDLTKFENIDRICKNTNVDVIFNTAAYVDVGTAQDRTKMYAVNVKVVENMVRACISNNINILVQTSSQDVAVGFEPIRNVNDATAKTPNKFLYYYAKTKYEGEKVVLDANKATLRNGGFLRTIALRPCPIYGEGDQHGVTAGIRSAHDNKGIMVRFGDPQAVFQEAYAGNVAWAHLLAMRKLKAVVRQDILGEDVDATSVDGKAFFIMDDTPPQNVFDFCKPFIEARGHKVSNYSIPFWVMYLVALFLEIFCFLLSPIKRIKIPFTRGSLYYMKHDHYFNYSGARKHLDYHPIYTPEEAKQRSMVFYKAIKFD